MSQLLEELRDAINRNSAENGSNTPDFVLAELLRDCLLAFDKATRRRDKWNGLDKSPGPSDGRSEDKTKLSHSPQLTETEMTPGNVCATAGTNPAPGDHECNCRCMACGEDILCSDCTDDGLHDIEVCRANLRGRLAMIDDMEGRDESWAGIQVAKEADCKSVTPETPGVRVPPCPPNDQGEVLSVEGIEASRKSIEEFWPPYIVDGALKLCDSHEELRTQLIDAERREDEYRELYSDLRARLQAAEARCDEATRLSHQFRNERDELKALVEEKTGRWDGDKTRMQLMAERYGASSACDALRNERDELVKWGREIVKNVVRSGSLFDSAPASIREQAPPACETCGGDGFVYHCSASSCGDKTECPTCQAPEGKR